MCEAICYFCGETPDLCIHVDETWHKPVQTHLKTKHNSMDHVQQDSVCCHTTQTAQEVIQEVIQEYERALCANLTSKLPQNQTLCSNEGACLKNDNPWWPHGKSDLAPTC